MATVREEIEEAISDMIIEGMDWKSVENLKFILIEFDERISKIETMLNITGE